MLSKKSQRDKLRRARLRDRLINDGVDPGVAAAIARGHTPKGRVSPAEHKRFRAQNISVEVGAAYKNPTLSADPEIVDLIGNAHAVYDSKAVNDRFTGKEIRSRHRKANEPLWTPVQETDPRTGALLYYTEGSRKGQPILRPNDQWLALTRSRGIKEGQAWTLFFS